MKLLYLSIFLIFPILLYTANRQLIMDGDSTWQIVTAVDTTSNYFFVNYSELLTSFDYYTKLDSIKNGLSADFLTLRLAYTQTADYNPYDARLSDLHEEMAQAVDSLQYNYALQLADSILSYNYVDIKTHLYCGYIYEQFKDSARSDYHYRCYEGLINSIKTSGDGHSAESAFIVITTKEEYALLNWYGLRFLQQSLASEDGHHFDIMKTRDEKVNQEYEIYFNIDIPYNTLIRMFDK